MKSGIRKCRRITGRRLTYAQTFLPGLEEKIRQQQPEDEAAVQTEDGEDGEQIMVYDSGDPYDIYYYQSMQQTIDSAGSEWGKPLQAVLFRPVLWGL